jgi:hypothetical protein
VAVPLARDELARQIGAVNCAYCRAPDGDLFSPNGNPICQRCDSNFKMQIADRRAEAQIAADPTAALTFASPTKLIAVGGGMVAGAVAFGLLEVFFIGRVHVWLIGFLLVGGMGSLYRGLVR